MRYTTVLLFFLLNSVVLQAQDLVQWKFDVQKTAKKEYTITASATIADGWYVYSQYLESDDGPIKTELVFEGLEDLELIGQATEEGKKVSGYDDMFDMNIVKYKDKMVIQQKVKIKKKTTAKGYITFMTCDDQSCRPPKDIPFEIKLK